MLTSKWYWNACDLSCSLSYNSPSFDSTDGSVGTTDTSCIYLEKEILQWFVSCWLNRLVVNSICCSMEQLGVQRFHYRFQQEGKIVFTGELFILQTLLYMETRSVPSPYENPGSIFLHLGNQKETFTYHSIAWALSSNVSYLSQCQRKGTACTWN